MRELVRKIPWPGLSPAGSAPLLTREWLVTNGLGGYASGTVSNVVTRRYHGLLIAALPAPLGRMVMLTQLWERVRTPDGAVAVLSAREEGGDPPPVPGAEYLSEFRLETGLPVWRYELPGLVIEKRLVLPHGHNTVQVGYHIVTGRGPVRLTLRPAVHFRPHGTPVSAPLQGPYMLTVAEDRYELWAEPALPPLRMGIDGEAAAFTVDGRYVRQVLYPVEKSRGYESVGDLWSPGYFRLDLDVDRAAYLVASVEPWEAIQALEPETARATEAGRLRRLLDAAPADARHGVGAELVLAADQFIVAPAGRPADTARSRAAGDEPRTVIAGYHWLTDWGRDTMISLEGLTLTSGRSVEAGYILRTFAQSIRDGLIPNLFPEGDREGLYHTADATLWFFHALDRYVTLTGDQATVVILLDPLLDIVTRHLAGTRFGIGVDPDDGLLRQGADGCPLTWMDAQVGDWVVTPRRGKAVEINALWYNALRLLEGWIRDERGAEAAAWIGRAAEATHVSFNRRFWHAAGGYLYDLVDGERGDDPACRPNQIFAISLRHAVLDPSRWKDVVTVVQERLLTPVGLRSLAPDHPDYQRAYDGDLRARDAAYHQGTVWPWLIGAFVDAWLKVYPEDRAGARRLLHGFERHLDDGCIGSISEIFDAEAPFTPRGCIAQAWSVAEVLRAWVKTAE
jgi:predicted glycogen debranching enzyme